MPMSRRERAMIAKQNSRRAKWKNVRFRDNRLEVTKATTVTMGGCWCTEPMDHEWPGKAEGAPHPVPGSERPIIPHEREREEILALQEAGVCPTCRGYPPFKNNNGDPFCQTCLGTAVFPPPSMSDMAKARLAELKKRKEEEQ